MSLDNNQTSIYLEMFFFFININLNVILIECNSVYKGIYGSLFSVVVNVVSKFEL